VHLKASIQESLNDQIRDEFYASYLYLSMSAWFEARNLPGFAHWMRIQSQEEQAHALRLFDFVASRRGHVRLRAIDEPPHEFASPLDAVQQAFAHEQAVSAKINGLYELAQQERDYATHVELQWFITEQVEEEESADLLVERVRLAADDGAVLLMLDGQLQSRPQAPPN
jgi:ferritin